MGILYIFEKKDMKTIFVIYIVGFLLIGIPTFPQQDIIVVKKDTLRCKIVENGLDTVTFSFSDKDQLKKYKSDVLFQGSFVKMWKNIKYVQFFQNTQGQTSTQELVRRFNFSHIIQYSNNTSSTILRVDTTNSRIYWFGVDFTNAKIKLGVAPRTQYSVSFFMDVNDFMLSDLGLIKYKQYFNLIADTGCVISRNSKMSFLNVYNRPGNILPLDSIRGILKEFRTVHDGIGLITLVTEINKETEMITFYITFFDLQSKTVLLCFKETEKAGGVGMAHHWTKPIIEFLDNLIEKPNWRTRYLKQ
jgi:hypothetical protein